MKFFPGSPHVHLTEEIVFPYFVVKVPEGYSDYNAALVDLYDTGTSSAMPDKHYRVMCSVEVADVPVPSFYSATYLLDWDKYYRCHIVLMKNMDSTVRKDELIEMELDYDRL